MENNSKPPQPPTTHAVSSIQPPPEINSETHPNYSMRGSLPNQENTPPHNHDQEQQQQQQQQQQQKRYNQQGSNSFRNSIITPRVYKPALSMGKFRVIAGTLCAVAFYVSIVSEYGDHKNEKKNVTSEFRDKHDEVLSNWLGFNVREKIRSIENSYISLRDSKGNKIDIDSLVPNANKPSSSPSTSNDTNKEDIITTEKKTEKVNTFLIAATGGRMDTVTQVPDFESGAKKVESLLKENEKRSLKLEELVEKQFQEILDKSYGKSSSSSSSS
ncbi:hypothetical protein ACTA71_002231 [Dictyostelium dimigraforme]